MATGFQAAPLVASPSYPNSVAWSKENLVAVASGHLITILNPASVMTPRGLVTLPPNKPFPIGLVDPEDFSNSCLMPTSLFRDVRPRARSISWSHPGFAPNSGCLLAVCTTGGRVKVYRPPFCEFSAEWVEVMDLSDMLHDYFKSINFGESEAPCVTSSPEQLSVNSVTRSGCATALKSPVLNKLRKVGKPKVSKRIDNEHTDDTPQDRNPNLAVSVAKHAIINYSTEYSGNQCSSEKSFLKKHSSQRSERRPTGRKNDLPRITAGKYASWSALLSALIVAWSPVLQPSEKCSLSCKPTSYSILAVGGKSGNIAFWRFCEPECYAIDHGGASIDAMLIGLVQAHKSWITAISWGQSEASSSEAKLVLATGSSDGSVRLWSGDVQALMKSSKATTVAFSLLTEVTAVTSIPISVISLVLPGKSLDKIALAIGKGSGLLEAWIYYTSTTKLQSAGVYDAHDQVVTGLTWAFDGVCLYSCSQDHSVRSWVLNDCHLCEVPFPSNFSEQKNSTNHLQISDPCFGLALSPGESIMAVVRSFDVDLLNQMYQARRQKAAVEFFWIGGQSLAIPYDKHLVNVEAFFGFSGKDLECWESNILWALKNNECIETRVVLWDVLAALIAFRKCAPAFVKSILLKWIASWFPDFHQDGSIENIWLHAQSVLSKISCRKIQLLNVICRRLMLIDLKHDEPDGEQNESNGFDDDTEAQHNLWEQILINCEKELRQRLVAFSLELAIKHASFPEELLPATNWSPVGVAQMEKWISAHLDLINDKFKVLGSKIKELGSRIPYFVEESCKFCSASVPFESPEYGCCEGMACDIGFEGHHRHARCAVSMKLCSVTTPLWHCVCCQRCVATLPPKTFFNMSGSPLDVDHRRNISFSLRERSTPLCPFCGILLQRLLPDFLLSPSLV